ncbi:MAG: hypothetical protein GYB55_21300 [Cytophagales bacterium]|uniref:hypothetical protein n=1 Tax=Cyclobacterium marinum TaxID=104 RepID=UPI0011EF93FD|nr:hypothetical protein [Cyclobacterium marinum]MBI0397571.1 hypothetical protein [Cyclobacterium marinum]MBR9777421.1 hypothetical protein [Cytophagales bacterium]
MAKINLVVMIPKEKENMERANGGAKTVKAYIEKGVKEGFERRFEEVKLWYAMKRKVGEF